MTTNKMQWFIDSYKNQTIQYKLANTHENFGTVVMPTGVGKSGLVYEDIIYTIDNLNTNKKIRYLFFKNGELITRESINKVNKTITVNVEIRPGIDVVEYYRLPVDTENVVFDGTPGYLSYGPRDNLNLLVPEVYDVEVTFSSILRFANLVKKSSNKVTASAAGTALSYTSPAINIASTLFTSAISII